MTFDRRRSITQLIFGTGAFAVCFAIFGSVSAMMPIIRKQLGLGPVEVSIALAVPVLLGSLARIPLGIATDRFGGRIVFIFVMMSSIVPAFLMGSLTSYTQLLVYGFFIGIGLASFSVGVGFVSRWFEPQQQGLALGIYGLGTGGQSLAAFGAPFIVAATDFRFGFWLFAVIALVWLVAFVFGARNAPSTAAAKSFRELIAPLREMPTWILSTYYFLTFGGFVAMSIYLPTFLTEIYGLTPKDAGLRAAGFALLATAMRPLGGWLGDRIGGRTLLAYVFPATAAAALLLPFNSMITFTIGALSMATIIGIGNGAVFRLVPEYFPKNVGAATGLVGAAGGLGGFFPPLLLGIVRRSTGSYAIGFVLLALFAVACWLLLLKTAPQREKALA